MQDSDLAELYQVQTFRLNEAVKRNCKRFPEDFMFQLTAEPSKNSLIRLPLLNVASAFVIQTRSNFPPHAIR